jgi:hypothetical protein
VSEFQPKLHKVCAQKDIPARKIVEEHRAARLKRANTLRNPILAPTQIFLIRLKIVEAFPVLFPEVKRWVSKNCVYNFVLDMRQNRHAITGK